MDLREGLEEGRERLAQARKGIFWEKLLAWTIIVILVMTVGLVAFRVVFVDHVENYELGYKFDRRSGKIERLHKQGYVITAPILVKVHTVDLRPMQVCINANSRVLNCKLVQFNPAGFELFISWHGRNDYDGSSSGSSSTDVPKGGDIYKHPDYGHAAYDGDKKVGGFSKDYDYVIEKADKAAGRDPDDRQPGD